MSTRMQQRRGTASQWISTNSGNGPILAAGEIGFESDTNKFKIGDGVNHWIDLTYFTDAESALASITNLVDGAPDLLNTLNELAAAIGDDPNFITTVATNLSNHQSDTTNIHGIANTADLATQEYVNNAVSNSESNLSSLPGTGLEWNATTSQIDIDSTIATKTYVTSEIGTHSSDTTSVHGIADTSQLATKTYADDAVSTHSSDTTAVHGIEDTSELATKTFAASLLTGAIKSNISITGDKNGLTITAENGVADSTTDNLAEGSNNKYFTDERAQDAVGNALGTGLTYTDATGAIAVDTSVIQSRVTGVSDTEIGYLDGVTSAIQTQIDSKAALNSPTFTGTVTLPSGTVTSAMILDGTIVNADINSSAAIDKTKIAGTAITAADSGTVTSTMIADGTIVDGDISSSAAIAQSKISGLTSDLAAKLSLAGGTMTGALTLSGAPTSDLHAATKLYVDNVSAGLNFHAAVHAATSTNITTDYNNGTNGLGATLTAMSNGAIGTVDGHQVVLNDRILVKAQTDAKQNGIYYVSSVGGGSSKWVLTRALDADNSPTGEIANGDFCFVQNGTLAGGYGFIVTTTGTITIGTTDINYTQFNVGQAVVAGNGLVESSPGTIEIDTTVTQTRVSGVSDTEIGYLDGVTSAIQTQLNAKANLSGPTFTGNVVLPSTTSIGNVSATELGYVDGVTSAIQTQLDSKLSSLAVVDSETASYTLVLANKDQVVEMNVGSANTLTVPLDSSVNFPIGTQIDILQVGSGQTTVVGANGVTINATPGLKLRAQWAGATLRKRGTNLWVLVGDLTV